MRLAVIDIGANTVRLLLADVEGGAVLPLIERRRFVEAGGESAPEPRLKGLAAEAAAWTEASRERGAEEVFVVATAGARDPLIRDRLAAALQAAGAGPLQVLSGEEEAELAFVGAAASLGRRFSGAVGVVDVGGGSTELAVGRPPRTIDWSVSIPLGSATLTGELLRSDPPGKDELSAARERVGAQVDLLGAPTPEVLLAAGGGRTTLGRLAGATVDAPGFERLLAELCASDSAGFAARRGLAPERVRLMPGALVILDVVSSAWDLPLRISPAGLREGLLLRRAANPGGVGRPATGAHHEELRG